MSEQPEELSVLQQESLVQALLPTSTDEKLPLSEIIENFEHLFKGKTVQLEKLLMESFALKEFEELDLASYFPKMNRGLPRLYNREHPANSHVKKYFSHLPTLKSLAFDKAVFSLYGQAHLDRQFSVSVFVYVINDGLGDYYAALEACRILKEGLPSVRLHLIALVDQHIKLDSSSHAEISIVPYEKEIGPDLVPHDVLKTLRNSDMILQMPTCYPFTQELMEAVGRIDANVAMPKMELMGEYGFLESSWFHPKTGNRSMGLHFLEKGIMIHKAQLASFADLENGSLLTSLFGKESPTSVDIETYLASKQFYLAYLATPVGGSVYLHALVKSLQHDEKGIDICTPDLKWFVQYCEMRGSQGLPLLEKGFPIESIEVVWQGQSHLLETGEKGKRLRIISPGVISQKDFRALVSLSGEFVGVRGDQSFSEAVSANRVFFYDGRDHARYFMKDLVALAENRVPAHRRTLTCFRGMAKTFLHNLPSQDLEWVDETYFQEKEDWLAIAFQIGAALQDPDAALGFKKFNGIVQEEYSCNEFLCHLVQRALCHRLNPLLASEEAELFTAFGSGAISFPTLIKELRSLI